MVRGIFDIWAPMEILYLYSILLLEKKKDYTEKRDLPTPGKLTSLIPNHTHTHTKTKRDQKENSHSSHSSHS